ncbi:hypothetical protein FA13DRAFT_1734991 [Coprinellus micaceus]|uniref:Uncharacterized protein n=1 Tax=Coprinellus micaceus TaxID=71717 RepID=A0A4Y7T598_COPMI|nr:hypothetical protein FA13DRAFT_1734991 [Coprinellus micaceus]
MITEIPKSFRRGKEHTAIAHNVARSRISWRKTFNGFMGAIVGRDHPIAHLGTVRRNAGPTPAPAPMEHILA